MSSDGQKRAGIPSDPDRRKILKNMAVGGAAAGILGFSGKWVRPVVDSVILPAHAQTSAPENLRFHFELINSPLTGQVIYLTQNGTSGRLVLQPGDGVPSPTCQAPFAFTGGGYEISVVGGQPSGDIHITVRGKKEEDWYPRIPECSGVEMQDMVTGPANGCYATDNRYHYTISNGHPASYTDNAPVAYYVRPCAQSCNAAVDGTAGTITISDDAGVIPTLTITVEMQAGCI